MTEPQRPPEAPDDYVLVSCANPMCDQGVWVPPFADGSFPNVAGVHSAECALEMVYLLQSGGHVVHFEEPPQ